MSGNNKGLTDWMKGFSYTCIVICTILVVCEIATTVWLTNTNNAEEYRHTFEPPVLILQIDSTATKVDSVALVELKQKLDTISQRQYAWHEGYLADLRQESNNNINKYNGWLSFWIALITLVLTIVPMVFNIRIERKYAEELERQKDKMEKAINQLQKDFEDKHNKNLNGYIESLKTSVSELQQLKVQSSAMGISAITDAKFFADDSKREDNWKVFLVDFNVNLNAFFADFVKQHPDRIFASNQQPIREVLVHTYYVLNLWSSRLKGKSQSKRLIVLMNRVSNLLLYNEHKPTEDLFEYYKNYMTEFRDIVDQVGMLIKEKT